jgi:pimeloyl-ACP methyl ester carboxylesterase
MGARNGRLIRCTIPVLGVAALIATAVLARGQDISSTAREGVAEVPGARLFFLDSGGSGPPVVLLHAGTGRARVWEHQLGPFTSAGLRVIAYDRRGFGRTVTEAAGPAGTAADDLEALATQLRLDRFHVIGTAAGGIVATDYALSFPKRLRSLVIANSIVGVQDEEYLELGQRLRPKQFPDLPADFRELGPAYRAANPSGTERWLALEDVSRAQGTPQAPQPAKNRITFKALETIAVPTLLITGDADLYVPPPVLELFAKRMPGAETHVFRGVGHSAYWEQPAAFNDVVLAFIRKH